MKWAVELISPMQIVLLRVAFGFVPVAIYAYLSKAFNRSHWRYLPHFFIMALLATTLYYIAFAKGTALLLSGVAGAVSGSIPLFAFILAIIFIKEETLSWRKVIGIILGFMGVLLIALPNQTDLASSNLTGVLYMAAGALSIGASFVYARKFISPLGIPAAALTTYQLGIALMLLMLSTNHQGLSNITSDLHTMFGVMVGLGLLGTGLAYVLYYYIVKHMGAVTAASSTYIPPVVALFIGAILINEPIRLIDYAATTMIFAGVFLLKAR